MRETTTFNGKHTITYGRKKIDYSLFSGNRKTIEIAVHPDSSVIVKTPKNSDISLIENKLNKRARWILIQLNYFRQFDPRTPARCYVNGETHLYLGKQYRLKVCRGSENSVKLYRGFFYISCPDTPTPENVKKLLKRWYLEKAKVKFRDRMDRCWKRFSGFGLHKPKLSVKRLQKRWGSLSEKGTVTLNTDLIRAPIECIDYVVSHELCHLKHHNHNTDFYKMLGSVIPGWEKIKHRLELSMV